MQENLISFPGRPAPGSGQAPKNQLPILFTPLIGREQENVRTALQWLIGREEAELALRFFAVLARYWVIRGYLSEGGRWLEAASKLLHAAHRTVALAAAAPLASEMDDYKASRRLAEESVALARELGDKGCLAYALSQMAWTRYSQGDLAESQLLIEESMTLAREVEDGWLLASSFHILGSLLIYQNKVAAARTQFESSVAQFRELVDKHGLANRWIGWPIVWHRRAKWDRRASRWHGRWVTSCV